MAATKPQIHGVHGLFHFRVTIHTRDVAIVYCLRALAEFSQKEINPRIAWGGTKDEDWQRDGNKVTFHFSGLEHRETFLRHAGRLLPSGLWSETTRRDDDPARPQS